MTIFRYLKSCRRDSIYAVWGEVEESDSDECVGTDKYISQSKTNLRLEVFISNGYPYTYSI